MQSGTFNRSRSIEIHMSISGNKFGYEWKNNNSVEILYHRFNFEEVHLLWATSARKKEKANWFFFNMKTLSKKFVCMMKNVIKFVIFFVSCPFIPWKKNILRLLYARYESENVFKYFCNFSIRKKKQNNLGNPHFYCFAVRFDVILSYTLQLWGVECFFKAINIRSLAGSRKILDKCNFTEGVEWIGEMFHKLAAHWGNKLSKKFFSMWNCLHAVKWGVFVLTKRKFNSSEIF